MERELLSVLVFHYSRVKINKIKEQTFQNSIKDKAIHKPTVINSDCWEEAKKCSRS